LTLLGAFLIPYRTKRLALGGLFVLVATTLIIGRLVAFEQSPLDALSTAIGSYPIIFLVGFMLTEPLTLPPRGWQQLLVATVVAVLFAVPFSVPIVVPTGVWVLYSSPELALVAGNVIAFAFGQRRAITLTLVSKKQLAARTWELSFHPARPVTFRAGQYLELTVPHPRADRRGTRRYFSISSAPGGGNTSGNDTGLLTIAFTTAERSSSYKTELLALATGSSLRATGVGGDFVLPRRPRTPLALIAGGIGITPFASQLASVPATAETPSRDCVVIYSLSDSGHIPYADVLRASGARVVLVAPEAPNRLPDGWEYAGAGPLDASRLDTLVPDLRSRRVYVSGSPKLVNSIRQSLRTLRVRRVATDHFSGY
jgi:ferredoxin-NADP reductase